MGVEEGVEDDWIELNQDVGPDKVEVTVTISPITRHHLNSTFALRVANSEGHQLYRVRMMDLAAAEEERQEGRVKTNVFAYVMSCLVILTLPLALILVGLVVNARKNGRWCWAPKVRALGDLEMEKPLHVEESLKQQQSLEEHRRSREPSSQDSPVQKQDTKTTFDGATQSKQDPKSNHEVEG